MICGLQNAISVIDSGYSTKKIFFVVTFVHSMHCAECRQDLCIRKLEDVKNEFLNADVCGDRNNEMQCTCKNRKGPTPTQRGIFSTQGLR